MRATIIAAALAALVAAGCGGASESDESDSGSAAVEKALTDAGLEICSSEQASSKPPDARTERNIVVADECPPDEDDAVEIQVTAWKSRAARDAAASRFESSARPHTRGYGAVWTLGALTIEVSGERGTRLTDRLTAALEQLGAGD